jgi:hypothetical protein
MSGRRLIIATGVIQIGDREKKKEKGSREGIWREREEEERRKKRDRRRLIYGVKQRS